MSLRRIITALALPALLGTSLLTTASPAQAAVGDPFLFLAPGFTQELYGTGPGFFGGVAFASNGDPVVNFCQGGGSPLQRFDHSSTVTTNGTTYHPLGASMPSNAGCGMTNHPNGSIYSNTYSGVTRLDATTGAQIGATFGPAGDALGIAPDPQTGNLVWVGSDGTFYRTDSALTTFGTYSSQTAGHFYDGIAFEPTGTYLFASDRSDYDIDVINRAGVIVNSVPVGHEPDGIAFHASAPRFVITNNTDGTITRFDFPGDDYSQPGTTSLFASGGFRGDLSNVGGDGCVYLTQDGTHFKDGTQSGNDSLVRICPGFAPGAGVLGFSCTKVGSTQTLAAGAKIGWGARIRCTTNDATLVNWSGNKFTLLSPNPAAVATFRADQLGDGGVTGTPTDGRSASTLPLTVVRSTLGPPA
jgi:DNA-binding beta-propeller fold protein YncE